MGIREEPHPLGFNTKQRPFVVILDLLATTRPQARLLPRRVSARAKNRIKKQNQPPLGHKTTHRHNFSSGGACLALCGAAALWVVMSPRVAWWCVRGMWIAPRVRDQTTIMRTPREHTTTQTSCGCRHRRNSRHVAGAPACRKTSCLRRRRKTALNLRKTALNLRKTALNLRKTALNLRKTALNLRKTIDAGVFFS